MNQIELDKFRTYVQEQRGIQMPSYDDFIRQVSVATSIWPQQRKDQIEYLFGKGVGVEIALQGEVLGRDRKDIYFPYRSHSDFEIYNCNHDYQAYPDSNEFKYVFGSQELYPKTDTKTLHNMPSYLMDKTYEQVLLNGKYYLIPNLELLFLDKYIGYESTPRPEGIDALCLLRQYYLDLSIILRLFDNYYILPRLSKDIVSEDIQLEIYKKGITGLIKECIGLLEEDNIPININTVSNKLNEVLSMNKENKCGRYGINSETFVLNPHLVINEQGNYIVSDDEYFKKVLRAIIDYNQSVVQKYSDLRSKLINEYNQIELETPQNQINQ